MRIDVLTLFPDMVKGPLSESIIGKAIEKNLLDVEVTDFRDYTDDKQNHVDDYPYGGGAGMLLQVQPILTAYADTVAKTADQYPTGKVILVDPAGRKFDQQVAQELSQEEHLTFICGHYEGYDERIRSIVTDEISLGDFVLTGGELPAMVMIDAAVRLLPEVLGNQESAPSDSFSNGLLEYPQYTRPPEYQGMKVPEVLMNGNHKLIADWREKESLRRTYLRRPDLLEQIELTTKQRHLLSDIKIEESEDEIE